MTFPPTPGWPVPGPMTNPWEREYAQPLPGSSVLLPGQQAPPVMGPPRAPILGQQPLQQAAVTQALQPRRPKPSGAMRRERPMFNRGAPGMPNGGYGQYQPKAAQGPQWGF